MTTPNTDAAQSWPIAAAMNNFVGASSDGTCGHDQPVESWRDALQQVAACGFELLDPTDSWVRVADLSPSRLTDFTALWSPTCA